MYTSFNNLNPLEFGVLHLGRGGFVHIAHCIGTYHKDTLLTPLHFYKFHQRNFFMQVLDYLVNDSLFIASLFTLIGVFLCGFLISNYLPGVGDAAKQLAYEYMLLDKAGLLTSSDRFDFMITYFETGAWLFFALDIAEKLSYFIMLRATLHAASSYYISDYSLAVTTLTKIAPLPIDSLKLTGILYI